MMPPERVPDQDWEAEPAAIQAPSPMFRSSADGRLVSYSRPSPGVTAEVFLADAAGAERFFWDDVRDGVVFAGFGTAAHVMAWGEQRFEHIRELAQALFADAVSLGDTNPLAASRLFGGFAFRDDFVPDNTWAAFHQAHFVLPHYQFVQMGDKAWLTINALLPHDEDPHSLRPELQAALDARYELLKERAATFARPDAPRHTPLEISYPMPFEAWEQMINTARARIADNTLEKVVLSRMCEIRFRDPVDIESALAYLNTHYHDCYRFLFEPRPGHAFLGASPELLAQVKGHTVTSMALAGSIKRSEDGRDDTRLGQELLKSAKDRHEHDLVVVTLLERLAPLCASLDISPQPGLYKVRNIQHLYTPVRGRLLESQGVLPIVALLHPTPALGGRPVKAAMSFIQEAEQAPRGWYGAPIGWIDNRLDGAFAVGIRSAVTGPRRAWLYAGSGIVADSEPRKEWDETALKFVPMLEAFGLPADAAQASADDDHDE